MRPTCPLRPLTALLAATLAFLAPNLPAANPDWAESRETLLRDLQGFLRLDTTNPPGNESLAAEYYQAILKKDGIESQIYTLTPGRGNLVARLKGNGSKRPLLLMGHTDVVGIERSKWTVDPFRAVIKDGYLYGRGALDDKSMTAVCVQVFRMLHRFKVPLDRDVILLLEAAEEGTPAEGIDFMVKQHWDAIDCEFALNEGGTLRAKPDGGIHYVGVATTEKVPRTILLSAHGVSGHGSKPRIDNAIVHLAAAVAKMGEWQPPMRLNDTTRTFLKRLATLSTPEEAFLFTHLEDPTLRPMIEAHFRAHDPSINSMLRTSISPNIIKAGFRYNVIPADALATLDVRWLPDEDVPKLVEAIKAVINDPAIEVVLGEPGSRKPTPPSRLDTELFHSLERVQKAMFPTAATVPLMLTGATDSAQLRERGVQAYGLGTVTTEAEAATIHGNDERVSIVGLGVFLEYVHAVVLDIAASK